MKTREKYLAGIAVTITILWFSYSWIIEPIWDQLTNMHSTLHEKNLQLSQFKKIINESEKLKKEYDQLSNSSGKNLSYEDEIASILSIVESVARKESVHISDMKPLQFKKTEKTPKTVISIEFDTGLKSLVSFLYKLEHSYPFHIENIRINAGEIGKETVNAYLVLSKVLF